MKRITRVVLTIAVVLFASNVFAQSFGEVFNSANELLQAGKKIEAANQFKEAYKLASQAGEEGEDIAQQCKDIVPALFNQVASEAAKAKDFATAKEIYNQVKVFGEEISNDEIINKAKANLAQLTMIEGDNSLNNKDFAKAIEIYNSVLADDPNNSNAYARIGMAQNASGNVEKAIEAYRKAEELGFADAKNQIANVYTNQLKKAINAKDYATALSAAENAISAAPNNTAYMYGGIAAYNLKNYTKAVNLLKNAEGNPNVFYYLAQSYEKAGNKASACAQYKKLVNDGKFGAFAKQKVAACK